jgi:hypothetical protein
LPSSRKRGIASVESNGAMTVTPRAKPFSLAEGLTAFTQDRQVKPLIALNRLPC